MSYADRDEYEIDAAKRRIAELEAQLAEATATIAALREDALRPKDKTPASRQLVNLSKAMWQDSEKECAELRTQLAEAKVTTNTLRKLYDSSQDLVESLAKKEQAAQIQLSAQAQAGERMKPKLDAAISLLIEAIIASCTCHVKSPDVVYHDAGCRYVRLQYALENIEQARAALSPAQPAENAKEEQ